MAARGNIVLNDGAATPVAHTFKPVGAPGSSILAWRDSNQAIFAGQAVISCGQRLADRKTKSSKMSWKVETPVLEVTSPSTMTGIQPAPTVAYTPLASMEFVLPDRMSLQERKDLLAFVVNLASNAIMTAQVRDLDLLY